MKRAMVSVICPVFNAEKYLRKAIESILNQTFKDFEFIIIDDGSTDNSLKIIESYRDERIVVVKNEKNKGLVFSLNKGLNIAKGKYIARMDADDIALKNRLELQLNFLEKNPDIGVLGGQYKFLNFSFFRKQKHLPVIHDNILSKMIFENAFVHPTVMFKKDILCENKLQYSDDFRFIEDYKLWIDFVSFSKFANLPETLIKYRISSFGITDKIFFDKNLLAERKTKLKKIFKEIIFKVFDYNPSDFELELHFYLHNPRISNKKMNLKTFIAIKNWIIKLKNLNLQTKKINYKIFEQELESRWLFLAKNSSYLGYKGWKVYLSFFDKNRKNIFLFAKFLTKFGNMEMLLKILLFKFFLK